MRNILLILLLLLGSQRSLGWAASADPATALSHAVEFLWSEQAADGAWRSDRYGVMRSGESLTPVVLYAVLGTIDTLSSDDARRVRQAAQFILQHLDDQGALGRSDPDVLEYPVYSTAYAAQSFARMRAHQKAWAPGVGKDYQRAHEQMLKFLRTAQYQASNGFNTNDVPFGGWGFNAPVRPGVVGHIDLAHTRTALCALQGGQDRGQLGTTHAQSHHFLHVMQKHPSAIAPHPRPSQPPTPRKPPPFDGGFYFSPTALSANKAPYDEQQQCWPSYATATCDGILALLASGVPPSDRRVISAVQWLKAHHHVDYPQGVPADHPEPWGDAIRYYHYSVRAQVYDQLTFPRCDQRTLANAIARRQQPNGSFVNMASPLMKEDDPLVSTTLAVIALTHCLHE